MPRRDKLPRSLSLKRRNDIAAVFREGRRFPGRSCVLVWQKAEDFRYAVIVSRKHGRATRRNRLKRLFREALRRHRHELAQPGRLIIMPRLADTPPTWKQVETDVCDLIARINRTG